MNPLLTIQLPCGLKELAAIFNALGKIHGPALEVNQSNDGKFMEFFRNESEVAPVAQNEEITQTSLSVQRLANALALQYYRGKYQERYNDPLLLLATAGPVADDKQRTQEWIEEQAQSSALTFWTQWRADAISFFDQHQEAESLDMPLPDLFLAGTVYCGGDKEEAAGDPVKYALVIRCHNADQANAALNTGIIRYTVFGNSKS